MKFEWIKLIKQETTIGSQSIVFRKKMLGQKDIEMKLLTRQCTTLLIWQHWG